MYVGFLDTRKHYATKLIVYHRTMITRKSNTKRSYVRIYVAELYLRAIPNPFPHPTPTFHYHRSNEFNVASVMVTDIVLFMHCFPCICVQINAKRC